jgi:hypothetical protein
VSQCLEKRGFHIYVHHQTPRPSTILPLIKQTLRHKR